MELSRLIEDLRKAADTSGNTGLLPYSLWATAADALSAKDRELAEARAFARKLSDALLKVRPLGGSELFTRVGEVFYADPAYCGGEIDRLRAELHAAKAENIKIKQEKFATTRARDEALSALREIATFDCGCKPCTGQCRKGEAAEIELEARVAIARSVLSPVSREQRGEEA